MTKFNQFLLFSKGIVEAGFTRDALNTDSIPIKTNCEPAGLTHWTFDQARSRRNRHTLYMCHHRREFETQFCGLLE
jgi:hypothetical protein